MVLSVAIILFLILPHPADVVVLVLGAVGEVGEIVWGRRLAKRWRPKTGPETMIGATAEVVGRYVHAAVPGSTFTQLRAVGHVPHLSAPEETTTAIRAFLAG